MKLSEAIDTLDEYNTWMKENDIFIPNKLEKALSVILLNHLPPKPPRWPLVLKTTDEAKVSHCSTLITIKRDGILYDLVVKEDLIFHEGSPQNIKFFKRSIGRLFRYYNTDSVPIPVSEMDICSDVWLEPIFVDEN